MLKPARHIGSSRNLNCPWLPLPQDGVYRWSMGTVYELPSRRLRQTFLIREYNVPVDPAASLDPRKLPIPDARPG